MHKCGCDRALGHPWKSVLWHSAPPGELPLSFAANLGPDIEGLRAVNQRGALLNRLGLSLAEGDEEIE